MRSGCASLILEIYHFGREAAREVVFEWQDSEGDVEVLNYVPDKEEPHCGTMTRGQARRHWKDLRAAGWKLR